MGVWETVINDESRRSFSFYLPKHLDTSECDKFFRTIQEHVSWQQPQSMLSTIPRKIAWMAKHGNTAPLRCAGLGIKAAAFPEWMDTLLLRVMPACGITDTSEWPDSCTLHFNDDGVPATGWQSDDQLFNGLEE